MIVGIIPGTYGAVAIVARNGRLVCSAELPIRKATVGRWHLDENKLVTLLDESDASHVVTSSADWQIRQGTPAGEARRPSVAVGQYTGLQNNSDSPRDVSLTTSAAGTS